MNGCTSLTAAIILALAFFWFALGFHIVHKPTDAEITGCEHTYINAKGEDTGECR